MWIFHLWGTLIHLGDAISCTKPYICIYPIYEEHQSELKKTAWYILSVWEEIETIIIILDGTDYVMILKCDFLSLKIKQRGRNKFYWLLLRSHFVILEEWSSTKYIRTLLVKTWYEEAPLEKIWITFFDGNIFSKKLMRWVNKLYCSVCGFVMW